MAHEVGVEEDVERAIEMGKKRSYLTRKCWWPATRAAGKQYDSIALGENIRQQRVASNELTTTPPPIADVRAQVIETNGWEVTRKPVPIQKAQVDKI
jgi:hypothetical protein